MRYAVYGTGGFGRELAPVVADHWLHWDGQFSDETIPDIVFVDDAENRAAECNGFPVIGFDDLDSAKHRDRHVIVAIGDGRVRQKIEGRCRASHIPIGKIFASTARNLYGNLVGDGSVLCDQVIITANARIGRSFQANIYSYVAHDCVIGDYVTFAPRVSCNGNVHIGDHVYVGTGAMFIQGAHDDPLAIGEGAVIGMGAVVTKPVEAHTVVAGNPARVIRRLDQE